MLTTITHFRSDVRLGLRGALRAPGITAILVCALSLGIAATGVSFSVMDALFIRPLAITEPDQLVRLYHHRTGSVQHLPISYPELEDVRELHDVFDGVVAELPQAFSVGEEGTYERIWGEVVSEGYFPLLGVRPAEGRFFSPEEETRGDAVAVIHHGLWTRRFGKSRSALDATIHIDGKAYSVIGVTPPAFKGTLLAYTSEIWIPVRTAHARARERADRAYRGYFALARLVPGVGIQQARAALTEVGMRLEREHPATNRGVRYAALAESTGRVPPQFRDKVLGFSATALVAALLLTVIACANAAGVLLARGAARRMEISIRLALGASRGRIVAQLLTEAAMLSVASGAIGLFVCWQGMRMMSAFRVPIARGALVSLDLNLDGRVLAISIAATLATVVLFGLLPAFEASRPDVMTALKAGGRAGGRAPSRSRAAFMIAQVALATLLLTASALFARSLRNARDVDLGFDPHRVVTTVVDIRARSDATGGTQEFWTTLIDEIRRLPQTESASLTGRLPLELGMVVRPLAPEGFKPPEGQAWPTAEFALVDAGFFHTLHIPIVSGRDFTHHDDRTSPGVVIVNDVLGGQFWPRGNAVGSYVVTPEGRRFEVIGVVRRSKYVSIGEGPTPYAYFPLRQGTSRAMTIVARGVPDSAAFLNAIGSAVRRLDPAATLSDVGTLSQRVELSLTPTTGTAAVLGGVGAIALMLTALGLFGLVAQTVSRRTHEIGVRRALGALDRAVVGLVMYDSVKLVMLGVGAGTAAAWAASRAIAALLYQVDTLDPLLFGLVALVLVAVCGVAAWLPAVRATRIDPALTLRHD